MKSTSKWILIRTLVLGAIVFVLLVAANINNDSGKIEAQRGHRIEESGLKKLPNTNLRKNPVELKFSYGKRRRSQGSAADHTVQTSKQAAHEIVGELKNTIALPIELRVAFEECGGPDSYYDENSHEIVICYELIDAYSELFSRTHKARTARDEAVKGAFAAMFLHEVGHALIHGWDLPITGREEDVADQFSTLMLINSFPHGDEMALNSARSFELLADLESGLEKNYSDPHSLDQQRFYDTVCLVYGHEPRRYEYLIRNGTLPAERAFECEEDYARANKAWQALLSPHLLSPNAPTLGF
jgi:hypothetical protein